MPTPPAAAAAESTIVDELAKLIAACPGALSFLEVADEVAAYAAIKPLLDKNPANYQPLTPLVFMQRAASVHPDHIAIVHGKTRIPYAEFYARSRKLASALAARGIGAGDTVSVMLANTPAMLEAHYGVPMIGAVLHSINTRLDAPAVAFMLNHANTKVLIGDTEFTPVLKEALNQTKVKPLLVDYRDLECGVEGERMGKLIRAKNIHAD